MVTLESVLVSQKQEFIKVVKECEALFHDDLHSWAYVIEASFIALAMCKASVKFVWVCAVKQVYCNGDTTVQLYMMAPVNPPPLLFVLICTPYMALYNKVILSLYGSH